MPDFELLRKTATQVRRDILRMIHSAKSGHPGGSLGCADILTCLYFEILRFNPRNFNFSGAGEDMMFVSNGHIAPAWYSVLARSGFFELKELSTLRKLDSRLQGHPSPAEGLPGVRIASGSLGQGLSVATGAAISKKLSKDKHLVYCLTGDGELQEGQIWEAAMFATAHKVDNLIAIVDYNGKQIDGAIDDVIPLGDLNAKWSSFGWNVFEMDGHNMENIFNTIQNVIACPEKGKPSVVIMKTEMGCGVDYMMGTHKWHGVPPNDDDLVKALSQLEETLGDY